MDILKIAEKTVKEHNMLNTGDRVLVGLSGGADSTALLYVLLSLKEKYNLEIGCCHVNHQLRHTADRDMNFCKDLCERLGVKFFSLTKDIKTGANDAGMSEELFARNVRYEFFESLGYDKIATAHNKNDVAETLVFNFMRGASTRGLSGIPYVRGNIVRPLLDIKKADIIEFCEKNGYDFVTDETNFEAIYSRNKVRLDLIPKIEADFNPAFVDVVTKNATLIREDAEYLDHMAREKFSGEVEISELNAMPMPIKRRVLELFWKACTNSCQNLGVDYIDDILELCRKNQTGKSIHLPGEFSAKVEYGKLVICEKTEKTEFFYEIYPEEVLNIPEIGKTLVVKKTEKKADFYLDENTQLAVRSKKQGDIFYPTKMLGKKKLSDFFTDKKIPNEKRNEIPIILANGKIVAVGDMRFSKEFQDTKKTGYKIEIKET
ncbi:MAG: tRNA lysidine(34) synthetase TilS [Clostridia bacterium]|nr:tRNA lysidine(34) synthetase TilS [Clostridia bacterium]